MLEDEIASCALNHYDRTLKRGKPKPGSEWTVFAAIVAQDVRSKEMWVVSCATGTKCTASRVDGCVVHDTHAEVLARRGLVRVLWNQLLNMQSQERKSSSSPITFSDPHCLIEPTSLSERTTTNYFRLRSDVCLHLYISDSPCGDGSIYALSSGTNESMLHTGAKVIVSRATGLDVSQCGGDHQLLDGTTVAREATQILGKLRIKSGRSNLPSHLRSTSMSCSDKIVQWCIMGLQGAALSHWILPIPITSVIVSKDPRLPDNISSTPQLEALERAITRRVEAVWQSLGPTTVPWEPHPPTAHIAKRVFNSGKAAMAPKGEQQVSGSMEGPSSTGKKRKLDTSDQSNGAEATEEKSSSPVTISPCGMSLAWQQCEDSSTEMIVGSRGILQGKKPKSQEDHHRLASKLSRRELFKCGSRVLKDSTDPQRPQLKEGLEEDLEAGLTYQDWKRKLAWKSWLEVKSRILKKGPLAGWLSNHEEGNFVLGSSD